MEDLNTHNITNPATQLDIGSKYS